jgi:tRNA:m4X modification enzyme
MKKRKLEEINVEEMLQGWDRCRYFIPHKQKLCRMMPVPGKTLCGNHLTEIVIAEANDENSTRNSKRRSEQNRGERIPCPLDPAHLIYSSCLNRHLKICNVTKKQLKIQSFPYFRENCNGELSDSLPNKMFSTEIDVDNLLLKIIRLYSEIQSQLPIDPSSTTTVSNYPLNTSTKLFSIAEQINQEMANNITAFDSLRHIDQDIAIIQAMYDYQLLLPQEEADNNNSNNNNNNNNHHHHHNTTIIEYGAGKGLLAYAISITNPTMKFALIERSGNRKKIDKLLVERKICFERYRMDIRHCYLPHLPILQSTTTITETILEAEEQESSFSSTTVIVAAKHLCGVATDLAIRSLLHCQTPSSSSDTTTTTATPATTTSANVTNNNKQQWQRGIAIATCCHHSCQFHDYLGKDWLLEQGISSQEFDILRSWTGWAFLDRTGEHRKPKKLIATTKAVETIQQQQQQQGSKESVEERAVVVEEEEEEQEEEEEEEQQQSSCPRPQNISHEDMSRIGKYIKRILDYGRCHYIQHTLGMQVKMQQYCSEHISPECILLLAKDR